MTEPLSGWAAKHITADALKALQAAYVAGGATALRAQVFAIAEAAGVTAAEVIRAVGLAQYAGDALVKTWATMVSSSIATSEIGATIGAGAAAATTTATTATATTAGGAGILAKLGALSVAGKVVVAAAVVGVVIVGARVAGSLSGDAPIDPAAGVPSEPRSAEERASDALAEASARASAGDVPTRVGFVVVEVTNHANHALSVRRAEDVAAHDAGERDILVCHFLHGGLCSDQCVDTPNGSVCGQDVRADLAEISRHPAGDAGAVEAWESLCDQVSDVYPAVLAEGWSGVRGDAAVTLDWANWIFPGRPCEF